MRIACVNQDPGIHPDRSKGAAVHLRAMREAFSELGAKTIDIDQPDSIEQRLEEVWAAGRIDLIYERYALAKPGAARFALRKGVPLVLEVNAPLSEEARTWRGYRETPGDLAGDRFVFGSAAGVIAVSTPVAEYAISRGARVEAVEVLPNGVDSKVFRPRGEDDALRSQLIPDGRFVVGFHGRLRPWHGFELLIAACRRLLDDGLPVHFVAVGNGDFSPLVEDALGAEHSTLVGWQPHSRIGRYVATFDALPLTYGDDQPFYFSPLKLAEAMACGVVPVVPDLGDLPATVGDAGLVYAPGDLEGLVDALRRLVEDRARCTCLARRSVERAGEMSWRRVGEFVLGLLANSNGAVATETVRGAEGP